MNPRTVHELMREHFPESDRANREWANVLESDGCVRTEVLAELIRQSINAPTLLVEVNRKIGDYLPMATALEFIVAHIGKGEIRVTDREFRGFVMVGANGVATGWTA